MENENENKNKNMTIILTIIGIATLLAAVVGATFAFYSITSNDNTTETTVTGEAESLGGTLLTNPTQDLHINLAATDMNMANQGKTYYAAKETDKNYEETAKSHVITQAEVSNGEIGSKYLCTSNLKIALSGTMKDELVAGDGKVTLIPSANVTIGTTEYDLKTLADATDGEISIPVTYKITKATAENAIETISAQVSINNTTTDQLKLAGKQVVVKMNVSEFGCNPVESFD